MNIGKGLIKSAKEALAIAKGKSEPAEVWEIDISDRHSKGNQEQVLPKPEKKIKGACSSQSR